jgi:hypothetical protein
VTDDVVDIAARAVAGALAGAKYSYPIGDGVNAADVATQETFPYVHFAYSGRDSRHIDPSEIGCGEQPTTPGDTQGGSTTCPVN